MPLYEYRCTQCNHLFEAYHPVGAQPGLCPACGGPVRRVFTSVGLIFKGPGFHATDYRTSSSNDGPATESKAESKSEGAATAAKEQSTNQK